MSLTLHIGEIVVSTEAEEADGAALAGVLREALQSLAERLQAAPGWRAADVSEVLIERLETTPLDLDDLLQPGGAARLAEALEQAILSEVR